ncbi:hypothetical protein F2Q68_00007134 [Brassica cretica]|uniref:Gamma-tubulin complex component n=1 Tax=Brassica cretica TaxID=69181 RepID=A0A8S9KVK2_BRACR|nr:hypothetical protein F2Q68_00007134 [Brassica cretica]
MINQKVTEEEDDDDHQKAADLVHNLVLRRSLHQARLQNRPRQRRQQKVPPPPPQNRLRGSQIVSQLLRFVASAIQFESQSIKILIKEENEVTEEALVRDVLYACQGIDAKFVKFNSEIDGEYGSVGQAFCAALQDELTDYYKLLAVLEALAMNPIPLMVRSWVLEGELEDSFGEFFVVSHPVKVGLLWREGYKLHVGMLPSFISPSLAQRILRTGKSINFLRVCCDDHGCADAASQAAAASGTTTRRGGLGYGETDALEHLVTEAAKRIDKHLLDVLYKRYKFKEHWPKLSEPANSISSFELAGFLEAAIRASNAQYDDRDVLDRLKVKMMPHGSGDRGWDVFSLEYEARAPLDTVFTDSALAKYLRVFNFLWKLKRVEHALIGIWKAMKPSSFVKLQSSVKLQLLSALRRCQVLWNEMNHFVTNFQYYIMFEVLEVSWCNFSKEMEAAKDLDDLLAAHEKYLSSIVGKSLLGEQSQTIRKSLFVLFELILRFRSHADRLYEGIYELQIRTKESGRGRNKTQESSSWISEGRKAITQRAGEFLQSMNLKFLFFRLVFTEFYSRLHAKGKES